MKEDMRELNQQTEMTLNREERKALVKLNQVDT
jgi:hypothetical protein